MAPEPPADDAVDFPASASRMPVLFVGHGNPMNAIEDNEFSRAWAGLGAALAKPKAVLCISAHWQSAGTRVTAAARPRTIHDFYGFPESLYRVRYPAPGSPQLAHRVRRAVSTARIELDDAWGLDHGTWSVLCRMFPAADVPVVQLSLDRAGDPAFHYEVGRALRPLRNRGVLVMGSGNIVHNLGTMVWQDAAFDWAVEFDEKIARLIRSGDHGPIIHYQRLGRAADLAVPTNEHFLPLLYALALQERDETAEFFTEKVTMGSISMRSLKIGRIPRVTGGGNGTHR